MECGSPFHHQESWSVPSPPLLPFDVFYRCRFTPPASHVVLVSLCDEEALSTTRESKDTAICIFDNETDTEDEDDDSQSGTASKTSIADHLGKYYSLYIDSTVTKRSPTGSEAAIGMNTTPAVPPARVQGDPIWTHDSHMDPFADPEPNQQCPCQANRTSAGDSTACTDPCLGVSDEQQLVPEATWATSEPGIMIIDALSDEGSCHGTQSSPAPLQCAHTRSVASTSRDDAIPGARTSSPLVRLSSKSQQEQDFDHTSCGYSDVEPESSEAESGPPFGVRVSPPSQELPSSHAHETVQDKDCDVDTEDSGSEDGLDVQEFQVSRQIRSTRRTTQLPRGCRTSVCRIESPAPSQRRPGPSEASTFLARFEKWPLSDVSLKRITEGDKATFQLQFEWTPDLCQPPADGSVSHPRTGRGPPKASLSATRSSGEKWTSEEEDIVRRMRQDGCSWAEIQRTLPHRSQGMIQVRFSTKLKKKG
ncbi:uncharacterized protein BKA55DRAFT_712784 [Fusarium redolens]|uniref:Myb-like domain-containing protein n=1 Tax=Fusarium redolens TaxID=48865 RepID=A0A9P9G3L2_FUSRE|nr:uncharacterized protein BKA55DRAFT_712784 [Fusarium redolens]KAH7231608.1 hypothetical protein BKA55DRAFT_712784 [Fusarium redolens]